MLILCNLSRREYRTLSNKMKQWKKFFCVIRDSCWHTCVGANTDRLCMWINRTENGFNGIDVYSNLFEHIRSIDFNFLEIGTFVDQSVSFCVTKNLIASVCTRIQEWYRNSNQRKGSILYYDVDFILSALTEKQKRSIFKMTVVVSRLAKNVLT
jgi:hypothetical protein